MFDATTPCLGHKRQCPCAFTVKCGTQCVRMFEGVRLQGRVSFEGKVVKPLLVGCVLDEEIAGLCMQIPSRPKNSPVVIKVALRICDQLQLVLCCPAEHCSTVPLVH